MTATLEAVVSQKEIGGHPHYRVRCWFCDQPIWVSHGKYRHELKHPVYRCNDCDGKRNGRSRDYEPDTATLADRRFHGFTQE